MRGTHALWKTSEWAKLLSALMIIIALCGAVFFLVVMRPVSFADGPRVVGGALDLRGADFTRYIYSLDGEWEFYGNTLYTPSDFADGRAQAGKNGDMIDVPLRWNMFGADRSGCATYRLVLKMDSDKRMFLYIPLIGSSARLWVNGDEVYRAGRVGTSAAETVVSLRNGRVPLEATNGEADIVLQCANYEWPYSGPRFSLWVGEQEFLFRVFNKRLYIFSVVLGGILLIGVYHLFLYLLLRRKKEYLVFFVFCAAIFARYSIEAGGAAQTILPDGLNLALSRVFCAMLVIHTALVSLFSIIALKLRPNRACWFFMFVSVIPVMLWPLFGPSMNIVPFLFLPMAPMLVSFVLAIRLPEKEPAYFLFLASLLIFMIWSPAASLVMRDSLYMPGIIPNLFLVLVQCVLLATQYAEARKREQSLAVENAILERTARVRADMIDTLSHEVRTPLSVMSVYAQLAVKQIREGRAGEQTMADLSTISEEAKRLAELANDALRLSALTDGEIVDGGHEMRPLDIAAVAGQLSRLFAPMAEKSGCALTAELPDNLPVRGDAGALTRLLWNLLDNALTHSNGRNIEVRAWRDADIAKVTVKDDGSGIAPEILPHIFERGVSGATDASGRTSQPRSMGIGLAICRQIAEEHGGAIIIKSGQGKGTEAVLTLPLYRGEDE